MLDRRPVLDAFVIATPAALGLWAGLFILYTVLTAGPARAAQLFPYALIGAVLVGVPIVVGLLIVVALPIFAVLRWTGRVTLPAVLLVGMACGLLARLAVHQLWGMPESDFIPLVVTLPTGLATGAVWWAAWNRHLSLAQRRDPGDPV